MSHNELLDQILPSLADLFESNERSRARDISPKPGEWEALRELFASNRSEGRMYVTGTGEPSWAVSLTEAGYKHYLPRIQALRALPTAS